MSGERATCCARLHPRQALWKEEEVCASVFGQLAVGAVYLLHAGLPFGKQPWGSSARQTCGLVRPLLVSRCDCLLLSDDIFLLFKAVHQKDWRTDTGCTLLCHLLSIRCSPGFPSSLTGSAARVSIPQIRIQPYYLRSRVGGGCYKFIPPCLIIKARKRGKT